MPANMSSLLVSQGLVLAAAMAVSAATLILFDLSRQKYLSIIQLQLTKNQQHSSLDEKHIVILKSCLSSGGKNKDSRRMKKEKRVHFAADVKDFKW